MNLIWSFVLPSIACVGLWLQASKNRWGWALNGSAQFLWAYYGLSTEQYGYTAFAVVFFTLNVKGFVNWRPGVGCTCECEDHVPPMRVMNS